MYVINPSRSYHFKSNGTYSGMYLFTKIFSAMLNQRAPIPLLTGLSEEPKAPVFCWVLLSKAKTSQRWSNNLLKNYLHKLLSFYHFKIPAWKVGKYNRHRTSVVGINESTTNICKRHGKTGPAMNLPKITLRNLKTYDRWNSPNARWWDNHFFHRIEVKACCVWWAICWANCIITKSQKVNAMALLKHK